MYKCKSMHAHIKYVLVCVVVRAYVSVCFRACFCLSTCQTVFAQMRVCLCMQTCFNVFMFFIVVMCCLCARMHQYTYANIHIKYKDSNTKTPESAGRPRLHNHRPSSR